MSRRAARGTPARGRRARASLSRRDAGALTCFFLSGAAGLVLQVVWIRRAALAFGSTTHALSTVLAVFFLGLALGSALFGRVAARSPRPLALYARLELGIAALAALSLPGFALAERLFGVAYRALGPDSAALVLARAALVALVLLPATLLMGGTLPLFTRHYVRREATIGRSVGLLYGLNTFGAALGAAVAGFVLLPALGLRGSVALAALLELACGLAVLALRFEPSRPAEPAPADAPQRGARAGAAIVAALCFLAGFAALGNEVVFTRYLALLVPNTVHTYAATLAVVLLGVVLGSLSCALWLTRLERRAWALGWLQALSALAVLALVLAPPRLWLASGTALTTLAALLLPAALLSGAAFPLAVRLLVADPARAATGVGLLAALNTLGGIAGALAVGFATLPLVGLRASVTITTGTSLLAGLVAWLALDRRSSRVARALAVTGCAASWLALPVALGTRLPQDALAWGDDLVDWREGREANVAVVRADGVLQLLIDRWWQGESQRTHQVMAAHVPAILHPDPRRVLVVGVGAGQTPASFLLHAIDQLDCVDIEPAVYELVRAHFPAAWMDDPRVRLLREDGRTWLAHGAARYDVIGLEVGQIFRPGVASFYTLDFYRLARARLAPGGMLVQLVPLPFFTPHELASVLATFLAAFPTSLLWYNTSELLLLGVAADSFALAAARLARLADEPIRRDLEYSPWGGPAHWLQRPHAFLAGFLAGPRGLAALVAEPGLCVEIYRDDRPVLEYQTSDARAGAERERRTLPLVRRHLEPIATLVDGGLPQSVLAAAEAMRQQNLGDIEASLLLVEAQRARDAGELEGAARLAALALASNADDIQASRMHGYALLGLGRWAEAERAYARALALAGEDARARLGLAVAHTQQGHGEEALLHFRAHVALRPDDPAAHDNAGAAFARIGRHVQARASFEQALRLDPSFAAAHRHLGQTLTDLGELDLAREHLRAALRLRPADAKARALLECLGG